MATTALPQPRTGTRSHRGRWIAGVIAVVVLALIAGLLISRARSSPAATDNVLAVPASALLPKGAGYSVLVPSADGTTTTEVDVQTGLSDGVSTEITSGLAAGDTVVTAPSTTTTTPRGGL